MQIYKASFTTPSGEHAGYAYRKTSKSAIEAKPSQDCILGSIIKIEVHYSEAGIIAALNLHGSHADNG